MEEAVDAAGKQARYQYNGLGHRVGKQEVSFQKKTGSWTAEKSRHGDREQPSDYLYPGFNQTVP